MFALMDFYEGIGKEIGRRQMAEEAQQLERPPRPSLVVRLLSKLAARPAARQALSVNEHDELSLDAVQCE